MSTLFLVRHAQASFLSDDYDRLSELGIDQSRQLGRYLAGLERTVDAVFVGPRRRHAHTAEAALEQLPGPAPECLHELDEYPAEAVLQARIGALIAARPELEAVRREVLHDSVKLPRIYMAWPVPAFGADDWYALDLSLCGTMVFPDNVIKGE